ncbi:hypothetical protein D3C78_1888360 [compost metagenome]
MINPVMTGQAKLQLIDDKRLRKRPLKEVDLTAMHIGYAEMTHLTGLLQLCQSFGNFVRLHQRVRPVQQQNINVIGPKSA